MVEEGIPSWAKRIILASSITLAGTSFVYMGAKKPSGTSECETVRSELVKVSSEIRAAGSSIDTMCPDIYDSVPQLSMYISDAVNLCGTAAKMECGQAQSEALSACYKILGITRSLTRICKMSRYGL